ncbi:hypothetical protein EV1_011851 [Malus domestica]
MEVLTDYVTLPSSFQLSRRIFGCVAYVHLHKNQRSKLDLCAVRCVFLKFNSQQKGYRCYHPPTKHFYVTMDVTFSETKMFFIPDQTHCTLQGELNSKDEDYSWFDVLHERDNWHGLNSTGETETEDLGVISNPLDHTLPEGNGSANETPDREIAYATSNSRPTLFMDSIEGNRSASDTETVQTENNTHSPPLVHAHVPMDIQEVCSHTPDIVENSYILHPRQNRGKPPDRFSPEGKVRYAIAQYVFTHQLSPKYQAMVNQMVGD